MTQVANLLRAHRPVAIPNILVSDRITRPIAGLGLRAMNPSKALPIDAIDLRADDYLPNGKIIVSLGTEHSPQRQTYSLPVTALFGLTADLQRLRSAAPVELPAPPRQPQTTPPSGPRETPAVARDQNKINITIPKRWIMRSGLPEHPLVYLLFDPQTERQAGYALAAATAREMAAGFLKCADLLEQHEAGKVK
jgi:hypothetical protein